MALSLEDLAGTLFAPEVDDLHHIKLDVTITKATVGNISADVGFVHICERRKHSRWERRDDSRRSRHCSRRSRWRRICRGHRRSTRGVVGNWRSSHINRKYFHDAGNIHQDLTQFQRGPTRTRVQNWDCTPMQRQLQHACL